MKELRLFLFGSLLISTIIGIGIVIFEISLILYYSIINNMGLLSSLLAMAFLVVLYFSYYTLKQVIKLIRSIK